MYIYIYVLPSTGPKENIPTTKFPKRPWFSPAFNDIWASYGPHPPGAPELAENLSHPLKMFPGTSAIIFSAYRFSTGTFTNASAQLFLDWNIHVHFVGIPLLGLNIHDVFISIPLLDWNIHDH